MDISKLIKKEATVWAEYPDPLMEGLEVEIAHVPRETLQKIRTKSMKVSYSRKTHQPEEEMDNDMFLKLYCEAVIKGWKGFKYNYLKEFMPVDLSSIRDLEADMEYTADSALVLMKNSTIFDGWITQLVSDITLFNKDA